MHAGDGILMYWTNEPQAPWQDARWLAEMRRSMRPNQFLRMIENRWTVSQATFVDLADYDQCVDTTMVPMVTDRQLPIWCGVDAAVKHDSSALCAVTWDQQHQRIRVVAHRIYQPTPENPIDFEAEIEQTLIDWYRRFNMRQVLFDPYQMAASSQRLLRVGLPMEEFPQTVPNLTAASQNLYERIKGRNFVIYPSEPIRLAISRAVAIEGTRGWRIGKDKQAYKIDIVVALAQAALAAVRGGVDVYDSTYRAFRDDAVDQVDGPTAWRLARLGEQGIGPMAPGAVPLGNGGYKAPRWWG
jgi:phage terminase large subunit-like protein